ncbi:MAG: hydantoinase/oxoprolinase family protein [Thermoleophilia bacterium]|nr:hydantoinase/oxoprolinase family protein [Thermoleophilia bacterium]
MTTTIDIDVGGTFTDCIVRRGEEILRAKSPTTGYNLSVGFSRAIEQAARAASLSMEELLEETDQIRYSTTLGTNTLIERKGARLGLLTTQGVEHTLFIGRVHQWGDGLLPQERRAVGRARSPEPLVSPDMVIGLRERLDCAGKVVVPLDRDEVRAAVRKLIHQGAQGFVVNLLWSFVNPEHELLVREIIEEEYPDTYMGSLPVFLSHEVQPKWKEYTRTVVAVLTAYLHTDMTEQLIGLGDKLRDSGYGRPLAIIHNIGGMAKVTRTRAVDTFQSGPVAGLLGSAYLGSQYGCKNILATDMGGTSFDFGVVEDGKARFYAYRPVIDRWHVDLSMIEVRSIGAGGGSIASVNKEFGNRLEVGPRGAGGFPGPACYNMGGTEPTVTDADVVLGYVNPGYFLGGKMRIDAAKARDAIQRHIAAPLDASVEEAAASIRRVVNTNMGGELLKDFLLKGYDPRVFTVFAYGGAGPVHCCDYTDMLNIRKIMSFPSASVFCAYGSSVLDLSHVYEQSIPASLADPATQTFYEDYDEFNGCIEQLRRKAYRDIKAEGFPEEAVQFALELEMRAGTQPSSLRVVSPVMEIHSVDDVKALVAAFDQTYERFRQGIAYPEGVVRLESVILRAFVPATVTASLPRLAPTSTDTGAALKGERKCYWEAAGGFADTPIYDISKLGVGSEVPGPAIVEASDTTYVVTPSWMFGVDEYGNYAMTSTSSPRSDLAVAAMTSHHR